MVYMRGEVMGIRFEGVPTLGDTANVERFANAVIELEKALGVLFDPQIAKLAVDNCIRNRINIELPCEQEPTAELEKLYQLGILRKTESRKAKDELNW